MCRSLSVPRSTYYYEATRKKEESKLEQLIQRFSGIVAIATGTRRIKEELEKA